MRVFSLVVVVRMNDHLGNFGIGITKNGTGSKKNLMSIKIDEHFCF